MRRSATFSVGGSSEFRNEQSSASNGRPRRRITRQPLIAVTHSPLRIQMLMNEVLTVAEVAAFLRVNRSTIYKLIRRGELPAFKVGSDWRFNRTQIEELFKVHTPDTER